MYNGATEDTPDKAQQGLLTERGMPPCILLIASRPALRERDIGTASMREAVKIEPVLEARKLDRTVCLRAFSILSPEMYPKACSRQNEKIKLHRPSLFSLRSGSAKEAENADGMTSENASNKNSGAPESLSLFLLPPYHSSGAFGTMKPPHTVPLYQTHRMLQEQRLREETAQLERERKIQEAMLDIKKKFGKNAILNGGSYLDGATAKERNKQIGGHKACAENMKTLSICPIRIRQNIRECPSMTVRRSSLPLPL